MLPASDTHTHPFILIHTPSHRRWFARLVAMNDWLIHARTGVTRHGYQQAALEAALQATGAAIGRCVFFLRVAFIKG